jgi:hypothetical protein
VGGIIPVFFPVVWLQISQRTGRVFQRSNEMFQYEQPNPVKATFTSNPSIYLIPDSHCHKSLKRWYSVFSNPPESQVVVVSHFINNSDHFLIHNIGQG